ncbi:tRNA (guanosine(46)-N7)-methyltransferase TrmB [Neorickettsia sennetsu]|uniref:tRNA (guanine-N(7)-)-methyltransferase n=1 Tax=Ehrlichia sennetsu (strain ATCC VR-367 / Miyayama) TaxID=222891 RepID=TRMB_EHRS3|nr:tRNA (guanosine(46)-N7)-methyltransferase TrmB [Neorickettsia sennetsu]Q2GCL0.1 RecName: Full=tRNA (guanine-N(7)-)-methyltransferase; AltName: Full=tRNA (guanine(46)-N(7))-methyltransferase; AltName: Full=tRNA(m7G46)-methyltransferase [Neorickettsia sennetsu str. Miyayama]ABD46256.1 putative tRNA (guanine-N(7)-)-methyltransferase [Neorickettsia sennetsu str. Miyayama]
MFVHNEVNLRLEKKQFLRSYGRRRGRNFRENKLVGLERFLASHEKLENLKSEIVLEVGFGFGEHILKKAIDYPDKVFVGAEVYVNGIARLLEQVELHELSNVLIWNDDVRLLLEKLLCKVFHKVYILFPDPWPKRRHHKRRIVDVPFFQLLSRSLHPLAEVVVATDDHDYAQQIYQSALEVFSKVENTEIPKNASRFASKASNRIFGYKMVYDATDA